SAGCSPGSPRTMPSGWTSSDWPRSHCAAGAPRPGALARVTSQVPRLRSGAEADLAPALSAELQVCHLRGRDADRPVGLVSEHEQAAVCDRLTQLLEDVLALAVRVDGQLTCGVLDADSDLHGV